MEEIENKDGGTPIVPPSKSDQVISKLNKLAGGQLTTGKVTDATDTKLYNTDLGASKYDKGLIIDQHLDTEDFVKSLQEFRARQQPVSHQVGNALVSVVSDLTLGTLGQIGSALDFEDYFNSDQEVGNWLTNITNAGQDSLRENFKNYRKNPGEHFAVNDSAWWIDTVGSLVGSIGSFALSGGILSKGLMGLSKLVKAQKLAGAMMGARKAETAGQTFNTVAMATMLNQAEGMMEASDVMEATYQFQLDKGLSEEEAREIAVAAGVTTLNTNRFNIALNLTSANLFLRATKHSNSMMNVTKTSLGNSLKRANIEGGQESLEELINMWAGKRGAAYGRGEDYSFSNVINDMFSLEALEAATLGFIGGMGQTVATAEGVNRFMMMGDPENKGQKISIRDYNKRQYAKAKEYISDLDKAFKVSNIGDATSAFKSKGDQLKLIADIRKAEDADDTVKAEQLKQLLVNEQARAAFDRGVGDHLIKLYEGMANGPQKEGMGTDYKQKAQEAISTIKDLQKIYDNHVSLEAGTAIYHNRAGRYSLLKGIKGAKQELAEAQSKLSEEIQRLTDGTDLMIDPNFKEIPADATPEEIALYEKIKRTEAYGEAKGLEGTIVDLNIEIDKLDDQYEVLKSPKFQEAVKKHREEREAAEMTKQEEQAIEEDSAEIETEAEAINEEKAEVKKEEEEKEAVKEAEAAEEAVKEEVESEFDKAVKNYNIGEQIPITSKLVDGLNSDEEHGGTLIEVDEEAGTMLVELEDGTIVTVHRNRKAEFQKPEVHTIPEADHSTEGGQDGKIAEPAPDEKNTTHSGQEGGAKVISRMDDGTPLLNKKGIAWMEEQFGEYLAYERIPMNKQGKRVDFEVNQPYTDNQRRAVNVYNKKVKRQHKDPITPQELRDLYYHLPLLANFGGNVKAPIENETREENRTEGDKSVENFENFTLPLRKGIIDALIAGKDINKIYTRVQDQYKGVLKVAPKVDGKVVENNVMDLDFIGGDFSKVDLWVVNDDNDLENRHGDTQPGGMAGKGEIYLMIKQANGEPYRLKLNVRRINEAESEVLYQLYKLRLLNQEVNKGTRLSRLPEAERKIIMDLAAPAIKVMTATGKSKNDLTVKDLTDFYVWDLTPSEKSRILMDKDGFTFGETTIHGKSIADYKEAFKTWLQENKRHHVKFKTKQNDDVILNAKVENYVKYLLQNGIINTNAVVNEPTFQKRTHIYLEPKAMIEGEEQVTPEKKSKERVQKAPMTKQGMSEAEAVDAVDEMFKAKLMEKKRSLMDQGVSRRNAAHQALEFYKDEMAEAKEKMMGITSEPAPVPPVKKTPPTKVEETEFEGIGFVKSATEGRNALHTALDPHNSFFEIYFKDGKWYAGINENLSDYARKQVLNDPSSNAFQFFEPQSMPTDMSNNINVLSLAEVEVVGGKFVRVIKKGKIDFKGNDGVTKNQLSKKPELESHNLTPEQQEATLRSFINKEKVIDDYTPAEQRYLNQVSMADKLNMADKIFKEKNAAVKKEKPITKPKPKQDFYASEDQHTFAFEGVEPVKRGAKEYEAVRLTYGDSAGSTTRKIFKVTGASIGKVGGREFFVYKTKEGYDVVDVATASTIKTGLSTQKEAKGFLQDVLKKHGQEKFDKTINESKHAQFYATAKLDTQSTEVPTPAPATKTVSTDVKGEVKPEEVQVDPTHPEIAELTLKLKGDISTAEMAYNAGAITAEALAQEKAELEDKYAEDIRKISEKIRKVKENVVSLEDIKKQERMEKLAARRAARNNPDKTPPNKNCN